ncbi:MAG: hypothetical protein OQK12_13165 [Motiliproteus sp.]|nr:hypothetical protein [Motiliproteus sp.]MCW9051776.1 hypothetical protein [Motiliproteus sp.]
MHHVAHTSEALSTDGYFFSSLPFSHSETIEALQLAVILGVNEDVESEVILVAHAKDHDAYQLAIVGRLRIIDKTGAAVDIEELRGKPIDELSEHKLREKGWTIMSKPYFIWLKGSDPIKQTKSHCIYSSAHHQLKTLNQLM